MSAIHACSSESSTEEKKNNGGTGGDAGEGGAPSNGGVSGSAGAGMGGVSGTDTGGSAGISGAAGAGDAAGQAGEATGGVSGSAGAGAGGQGGEGAVGPGAACTMCMEGSATALQTNCGTSPDCAVWLECVQGCSDAECLDACDRATPQVAPYQYAIYEALCDACATECTALELCDRDCVDNVNLVPTSTPPATLAGTGLYETPTATPDQVAPYARPFHPEYELWSDGAQKRRWAYIPRCSRIGTGGINRWLFPVGTRMWKEFTVPAATTGNAPVRVETRFIHRYGPGESDWVFAAYQWPADNSTVPTAQSATLAPDTGVMNANGTMHDIPARGQCVQCHHQTLPDKVLGFSAVQLSHMEGGVTIRELADNGWLTDPFAPGMGGALARNGYDPPGDEATQRALGYFHANCGNCHNIGTTHGENPMANVPAARLQLMIGSLGSLQETYVYTTLFDQPTTRPAFAGCDRIEPGSSAQSEVILRMSRRDIQQMPPIGTEQVHAAAITNLRAWIDAMPTTGTSACVPPP